MAVKHRLLPEFFYIWMELGLINRFSPTTKEGLEQLLEYLALNGWDETYLREIRRMYGDLPSRKTTVPYETFLKYWYMRGD